MATVHLRNVPDDVHARLEARARRNGRSLSAELRAILDEAARPERALDEVLASIEEVRATYPLSDDAADPTELLREDRHR